MELRICTIKESWDTAWAQTPAEFLQSYEWGEFQRSVGHEPVRLQIIDQNNVVWQGQGFIHCLPLGLKYIYFPRVVDFRIEILELRFLCKKEFGFIPVFIRVEPIGQSKIANLNSKITTCRQPKRTLILDLTKTEEELLNSMHAKTRYNIRVAEKHGVEIRDEKDADVFWQLNTKTTARDKFKSHDKAYYEKMLQCSLTRQYTAWYNGIPIASHIYIVFGGVWTYLHGTSGNEHRNVMAPYLLHWYSIQKAKESGCNVYDFWGIAPTLVCHSREGGNLERLTIGFPISPEADRRVGDDKCVVSEYNGITWQADHAWTGITRYKVGFGGMTKEYPSAFEISVRSWLYKLIVLIKKIR